MPVLKAIRDDDTQSGLILNIFNDCQLERAKDGVQWRTFVLTVLDVECFCGYSDMLEAY